MQTLYRKTRLIEFVPSSQRHPATDDGEKGEPIEDAAVYVYRALRRREHIAIAKLTKTDKNGDLVFNDVELGYMLGALCLDHVRNINVEDEDGTLAPLVLEFSENGSVTDASMDLFSPADLVELSLDIYKSARPTTEQGEK